jgi:dimethylargininase
MLLNVPIALTRAVSPALADCELTHVPRVPIDIELAIRQHAAYERALEDLGFTLLRLEAAPDLPDSVFVEDAAVVLDEVAIVSRPGAASRRPETAGVADALVRMRRLRHIVEPGTLDGGDVLRVGRQLFVGRSLRTNDEGIGQLRGIAQRFGWSVHAVPLERYLHLKSAVTAVAADTLLVDPRGVSAEVFDGYRVIEVDPRETSAANALLARETVIYPDAFPATAERLRAAGIRLQLLDVSEIAKAEGGVTCCSILIDA